MEPTSRSRKILLRVVEIGVACLILLALLFLLRPLAFRILRPALLEHALRNLSDEERNELYEALGREVGTLFDAAPDPSVGRLGKRNVELTYKGASVRTNNAGLRDESRYEGPTGDRYRLVCLGDSFVFGEAAAEADRFCDQMEAIYARAGVAVGERRVETQALGLPSWTMVQEATYLARRISAYDPDVILVLTTANDITDAFGVSGSGTMTARFSPEHRDWGSAVFTNQHGLPLGNLGYTALTTDLSPEARRRWHKAMTRLAGLVELQHRRGKQVLLALLEFTASPYFIEIYKSELASHGIEAPVLRTDFFSSPETRLTHDGHPNRRGHGILAAHFVHALDRLGWIDVPDEALPPLDPRLSLEFSQPPRPEALARLRDEWIEAHLRPRLDFRRLEASETMGLLGGLLFDRSEGAPAVTWASVRSAFLLRRRDGAREVRIGIQIPDRIELLPFELRLFLDGQPAGRLSSERAGPQLISAPLPPPRSAPGVLEVRLETDAYYSGIGDARMKSFRLLHAAVE